MERVKYIILNRFKIYVEYSFKVQEANAVVINQPDLENKNA
jgi:hypothetical protein